MNLLADAIKRAGSTDKKAVAAALKATKEFKGISGPVSFTDKNLLARSNFVVLLVKDKKFTLPNNPNPVSKRARAADRRGLSNCAEKGQSSDDL